MRTCDELIVWLSAGLESLVPRTGMIIWPQPLFCTVLGAGDSLKLLAASAPGGFPAKTIGPDAIFDCEFDCNDCELPPDGLNTNFPFCNKKQKLKQEEV